MRRLALVAVLTAALLLLWPSLAGSQTETVTLAGRTAIVVGGGASGGDWLNIPLGDVGGLRNIQCGADTGRSEDLNCDIAGGDAKHRGHVIINYDLGRCVAIYDGHESPDAVLCAGKRPWFRRKPRIGGRPPSLGSVR